MPDRMPERQKGRVTARMPERQSMKRAHARGTSFHQTHAPSPTTSPADPMPAGPRTVGDVVGEGTRRTRVA